MSDSDSDKEDLELLRPWLEKSCQIHEERDSATYNGVLGSMPHWVPEWHKTRFRQIRNRLLDTPLFGEKLSPEKLIEWMDSYCRLGAVQNGEISNEYIPPEVFEDVGELAHYRWIVSLGKKRGFSELDSKAAPFHAGGTSKKGKYQEPKASINQIVKSIDSRSFDDVMAVLRDAEQCADLYESTHSPIGVQFIAVDDNSETIQYLKRGDLPDKPKSISFKRLRNILSELKE